MTTGWGRPQALAGVLVAITLLSVLCAEERARLLAPVLVATIACLLRPAGVRLPALLWAVTSVVALTGFLAELFVLHQPVLFAATHLLLYLLVNKVHHLRTVRDHDQLLLIAFLTMLAVGVLAVEIAVLPFYLVFLLVSLRILDLLQVVREGGASVETTQTGGLSLGRAATVSASVLVVGLVVFALFPRVGAGTVQSRLVRPQHVSGFSAEVALDDIGRIKTNDELVARVRLRSPRGREVSLLRVSAYQQFDGLRWRRDQAPPQLVRRDVQRLLWLGERTEDEEWFEITVEPLSPPFVPIPVGASRLRGPMRQLFADTAGSLQLPRWDRHAGRRLTYEVVAPASGAVTDAVVADAGDAAWLDLPEVDPRLTELAQQLIGAPADRAGSAAAVSEYLGQFAYSLEPNTASDPIAGFLFDSGAGHCELFASAMAVLLRSRAIPARVVNGFRISEWNSLGEYFIVRQADAHAWVEVLQPGEGWVTYDPTPPDPSRSRWLLGLRGLSHLTDFLLVQWDRWVISFSGADQAQVIETIRDAAYAIAAWLGDGGAGAVLGVGLVLGTAAAVLLGWRRRRRDARGLYLALRAHISRASGAPLAASIGPAEVRDRWGSSPDVRRIVNLYIDEAFAGAPASPAALAEARSALASARRDVATQAARLDGSRAA